mgnify:CR=1 FL=1|jgi:hypothetical protein
MTDNTETGVLQRVCSIMHVLREMPEVQGNRKIDDSLKGLIKALDPGPPVEEVAGPSENGHPENRSLIDSNSSEIQARFAKECIGIATVELNQAYEEFVIGRNGHEFPMRRLWDAHAHLRMAMQYLNEPDAEIPF